MPDKEEVRSETKGEDEDKEAEAKPRDDKIEEARREVVESLKILLATQVTLPDNNDIVTRADEVTGLVVMVVTSFLQSF